MPGVVLSPPPPPFRDPQINTGEVPTAAELERPDVEAQLEGAVLSEIKREPTPEKPPSKAVIGPFSVRIVALLMPFSVFGVLARLGIQALMEYDGASIFPLAWVQAAGCFAMGLALGVREPISEFYPELYTAFTSGFCGSLTTFSSWQLDVFLAWSNKTVPGGFHRVWLYDVIDGLTRLLFTLAISMASLTLGFQITSSFSIPFQRYLQVHGTPPSAATHGIVTLGGATIYFLTIPMYFVLSSSFRAKATSAILFSFPGAFTRYALSIYLNPLNKSIPPGTLAANIFGTLLLALFRVLERVKSGGISFTSCVILKGLSDGYCGSLTTVSTFASELRTLKTWLAWRYATISVVLAQAVIVLVLGSAEWSGGVKDSLVCKG
ncbi:hypothetical protein FRB99_005829 [Tulasnella sp. 403]|nr:hypothetical protein FRB99_005829 [Tulasnella sp. 403]